MQFRVVVEEFLRFCELERQHSICTVQAYSIDLSDFYKWLQRDAEIEEITPQVLKQYLEYLVENRRLAPATIRRRFACLRAFFRRIAECGHASNPFSLWHPALPRRKRLPRSLTRAEASFLLQASGANCVKPTASEPVFHMIVRLMIATGMRVGEVCKLRTEDMSPDCSVVRIQGKGARDRVAYITDSDLRMDLAALLKDRQISRFSLPSLFLNRNGAAMRPQSVRSRLRRLANGIGFGRRITPHMLRHTAATLLIESGVDIRFVQRLLGHSSIATTEIYTHISDEALRSTLQRADVLGALVVR